jgi:hypothetical protein
MYGDFPYKMKDLRVQTRQEIVPLWINTPTKIENFLSEIAIYFAVKKNPLRYREIADKSMNTFSLIKEAG